MAREKNDTFDLQTGMAVYTADGQKFGTVSTIAGFGSTRLPRPTEHDSAEFVIQAKTSSGYFNVDREGVPNMPGAVPLCVPFHGIEEVRPDYGVILNTTIIKELADQGERRPSAAIAPKASKGWLPKWLRS